MTRRKGTQRSWRDERGVALVEFALILPILLALLVGVVQFGKGFFWWLDLSHLANTGGRMAVVDRWPGCTTKTTACTDNDPPGPPDTCGDVVGGTTIECTLQTYLKQQANSEDVVSNATVTICFVGVNPADANVGTAVRLTVSTPYTWFNFFDAKLVSFTLRSSTTMRLEQAPRRMSGANRCPGT